MAAYIKKSPCMFQNELVGVRLVFAVGDIHLKFICLWKQTSSEKQDKLFLCSRSLSSRLTRIKTGDKPPQHKNFKLRTEDFYTVHTLPDQFW